MEYSKEFKAALSQLSPVEKDRLIFRLLRKDEILSKKLYFELIDEETVDQKRDAMEELIKEKVEYASKYISNQKYFTVLIRKISAQITEHVKVTTDKFGDISLNLLLINEILESNEKLSRQRFNDVYKLYLYIINKIVKALVLTKKLDEDYWMEIDQYLTVAHEKITANIYLEKLFINNGIDFNWLNIERIPDNFDLIIKDIKNQGFLK
ncbi:deoxyuridine 5'-triphosphate nucleotidohydrolase [Chryseobacterium sp. Ch-15]|uniref:Deoxyuridine 5'-triphosphate nucleotidohydrolase n=1 Tax=Chryseobacterium muglaense TaxID=2893752 RepID=A0A9Q3UY69_9FLAO|nr:deoxyuridine 5'-triphosphate nucleotidohydrolase [Chryseobacterium muglaense]MBD3904630.1 deoxyuridine 5'-triphosphate nucleotidohydrolase [Chryseobacterium muglaense]MCC9035656.1 deoxyuridine 5'-triphosphate nucleotidohydrolase [Chryseobacterium muglaense]MCM2555162.1 deoxyuridine 5'-triphosphate nucleotidohydrolase [Chryseobacterium muglaense]